MPKDKAPAKGQKSIDSFFGKGKNAKKDDSEDSESEIEVATTSKAKKTITKGAAPDSSNLPPIHDIPTIFSDLVSRTPGIKDVAEHVNGRKIRVATMCSGTESPLLALELIQHSIQDHYQLNLDVEHVFSCEIEPFKQAYIERNFHPPILFRDVCELGNDEACVFWINDSSDSYSFFFQSYGLRIACPRPRRCRPPRRRYFLCRLLQSQ